MLEQETGVRYPEIEVQLVGSDGNAFAILGKVRKALRRAGVSNEKIEQFTEEATSGDYDYLLGVCVKWVDVS